MAKKSTETEFALINQSLDFIKNELLDLRTELKEFKEGYVRRDEFEPVKRLVFGLVGLILVEVVTAVIALVIMK